MLKSKQLKNGRVVFEGVTPKGQAMYARVHEPQTKVGTVNIDPSYSMTLLMPKDDTNAQAIMKQLDEVMVQAEIMADEFAAKAKGRRKDRPQCHNENYGAYYDNEGNETEFFFIKAKSKACGVTPSGKEWSFKPVVFDASGKPFPAKNPPLVGNGSECRMAITVSPYAQGIGFGLSIHLDAVQVLNLVEYHGRSASSYGFSAEEGYKVTEENQFSAADAEIEEDYGTQPKSYRRDEDF